MRATKSRQRPVSEIEIGSVQPERTTAFRREHEREALSTLWKFRVIWHEQRHELAALDGDTVVGALGLRIAASLAHLESLIVAPPRRRRGIGRQLVTRAEEVANYYNCHKMTLEVPVEGYGREFFAACGYTLEATLPQHTFKLDVAIMRKFLL
jgi:ribosomal protein S18 acetylase RimI-like enzyme